MSSADGAAQAVTITIPPNIALLTGPQLLGLFFNWGLLGVLGTQVYIYYLCFPRDSVYNKSLVYGLFILEIVQTCMLSSDAFHWLVLGWGRPDKLGDYQLTWFDVPIMGGIISATVQILFAWRIYRLGKSWILGGAIAVIALTQGAAGVASGIQQTKIASVAELGTLFPAVTVWLGGSALVDIIIAVSMTYLLSKAKGGFGATNYLLTRLVRLTVETGALTATVATLDVILFNVFKDNNLHMCPAFILAKLYTNTLMVVFNQRIFIPRPSPLGSAGSVGRVELEPSEYYSARLRGVTSPTTANRMAGTSSFRDAYRDSADNDKHIPMGAISSGGRIDKFHGLVV